MLIAEEFNTHKKNPEQKKVEDNVGSCSYASKSSALQSTGRGLMKWWAVEESARLVEKRDLVRNLISFTECSYISHKPSLTVEYLKSIYAKLPIDPSLAFKKLVEDSRYITHLEEGWDEDQAKIITYELFSTATQNVSTYIDDVYFDSGILIESPSISPVANGSIDFEWTLSNARFLLNYRYHNQQILGFYYGDLYKDDLSIKGTIPLDKTYDYLIKWMKFLK
jgi:hypothetical protein